MLKILDKIKEHKRVLIEASAGTGKTYTLENIIFNLLKEKIYLPSELVVLTFTKKAAKEMKDRILNLLNKDHKNLKRISKNSNKIRISTIHKFVLNSLNQFQNKNINSSELIVKEVFKKEIEEIFYEFIRKSNSLIKKLEIPEEEFEMFKNNFSSTEKLLNDIKKNYKKNKIEELGLWLKKQKPIEFLLKNKYKIIDYYNEIISKINKLEENEKEIFFKKIQYSNKLIKLVNFKKKYKKENDLEKIIENLQKDTFISKIRKNSIKKNEILTKKEEEIKTKLQKLSSVLMFSKKTEKNYLKEYIKLKILYKILNFIENRLEKFIDLNNIIDQNHLIKKFLNYLEKDDILKNKIKNKYKLILIDEAQDIDKDQIKIFNILAEKNIKLVFIADPKQIIYSFRNSDILLYNTEINKKTDNNAKIPLNINYRASNKIMEGINKIFENIYSDVDVEEIEKIKYRHSKASKKNYNNEICLNNETIKSINIIKEKEDIFKETASAIKYLLQNGKLKNENEIRKIKEGDIKILCGTRLEIELIYNALIEENINVFKAENSLIESKEFKEVFYIIKCFDKLKISENLNYVLASKIINLSWDLIIYLKESEKIKEIEECIGELEKSLQDNKITLRNAILKFESEVNLLLKELSKEYKKIIKNDKSYKERLILEKKIKELKNYEDSLDFVSNLYYEEKSIESLINKIENLILENDSGIQLKNEYDLENTVEILTIHKSKGLSFNIIFLINQKKIEEVLKQEVDYKFYEGQKIQYDFFKLEENAEKAQKKIFNEEKNLFYVALTRAKYGIFILKNKEEENKKQKKSPILNKMLKNANIENIEEIDTNFNIEKLKEKNKNQIELNIEQDNTKIILKEPNEINKNIFKREQFFSYSKLKKRINNAYLFDIKDDDYYDNNIDDEYSTFLQKENTLPKGKHIGNIFHKIMEEINFKDAIYSFEEFSKMNIYLVKEKIKNFDINLNKEEIQTELLNMVYNILNYKIDIIGFKLIEIKELNKEVEFLIKINNKEKKKETLNLEKITLSDSYLKGIIDLVIKVNNKIYIIDYKTNYLGSSSKDYEKNLLEDVMKKENYDIQCKIYSLGIKKIFFKNRENYNKNFGGVIYIFTRAFIKETNDKNGIFYFKPSIEELNILEHNLKIN